MKMFAIKYHMTLKHLRLREWLKELFPSLYAFWLSHFFWLSFLLSTAIVKFSSIHLFLLLQCAWFKLFWSFLHSLSILKSEFRHSFAILDYRKNWKVFIIFRTYSGKLLSNRHLKCFVIARKFCFSIFSLLL